MVNPFIRCGNSFMLMMPVKAEAGNAGEQPVEE
jgi:hypothetical protein